MSARTIVFLASCGALASCSAVDLEPVAPHAIADSLATTKMPPLPALPASVIDAPITYNLASALQALEQAVPRQFGNIDQRLAIPSSARIHVAFHATRTPLTVAFDGRRTTITTVVSYQGRGWYKAPLAPTLSSSCGTEGELPRVRLVLTADVEVTPNWTLVSKTRVRSVTALTDTPRDQCLVTPFKVDVTDRVAQAVEGALRGKLAAVDRRITAIDVHTPVERWYNLLNRSLHVRDSVWLSLTPEGALVGDVTMRDSLLVLDLRLYVRPAFAYGQRPPPVFTPLPPFTRGRDQVGDSAMLRLEGLLTYQDASAVLTKQLTGRKFRRFNRSVVITDVRLYAIGDGRVVVDLHVAGDIEGNAYFLGTPRLDTLNRTLTVPDLDFDVGTSDALVQGLAWFRKADIVAELRRRAIIPLGPPLESLRGAAESALDRELTRDVRLSGRIHTGRMIDVVAQTRWLVVRAEATGSMALRIDRAMQFPAAARKTRRRNAAPKVPPA